MFTNYFFLCDCVRFSHEKLAESWKTLSWQALYSFHVFIYINYRFIVLIGFTQPPRQHYNLGPGLAQYYNFIGPLLDYNIVPRLFGHGPLIGPILAIFKLANIGPLLAQYQDQYWANVEPILFSVGNSLASNIVPRLFGHGPWLGPILACPW